ncbi:hypothetical protein GF068_31725 [Polyangium spumosum]|uniref:TonB C-terminal domain-containing protein n=2 Tax=Polyangium spumosum TaxID=889282 RepID=A0A6N7Q0Z8_9BACT|nr:hypothetical protein [Polyangium spumosum]
MRITSLLLLLPCLAACQASAPTPPVQPLPVPTLKVVPAVPYDLPRAAEWADVVMVSNVGLDANGAMTLDGKPISSDDAFRRAATRAREQTPDLRILIHADARVPWRYVVHVMTLLKQSGIQRFAFGVVKPSTGALALGSPPPAAPNAWDCPFPKAADAAEIDEATVVLTVAVSAEGAAEWVQIKSDPGHGFGMAAAQCAMLRRYAPGRDDEGRPKAAVTPPIRVRFMR